MFPISIASKLKIASMFLISIASSLGLLMQFFHVHVEITVIIICHFLLLDYKNICDTSRFLNVTQYCSMSFSTKLHLVGYLYSVGQTLYMAEYC